MKFIQTLQPETTSSILLGLSLICALVLSNHSATEIYYQQILNFKLSGLSVHALINDGLMTLFFYMIGMEVKREIGSGSLSSLRKSVLPILAAIGGMVAPAVIFSLVNREADAAQAWGIPIATDIAFALGALIAVQKYIPKSVRSFLLTLAVIDDIGAIVVIALFYSTGLKLAGLGAFAICACVTFLLNQKLKWSWTRHIALGLVAWSCMAFSGVHATLAGVLWGFLTPSESATRAPLDVGIQKLSPLVSFFILPLFALANSRVKLPALSELNKLIDNSLFLAIILGLSAGKPIGIGLASWISVKLKVGELPKGVRFRQIWGVGLLAGIGFTMAIFISELSLTSSSSLNSAKLGILVGSLISAIIGGAFLICTG